MIMEYPIGDTLYYMKKKNIPQLFLYTLEYFFNFPN